MQRFGDEVLMHHEFSQSGGQRVAYALLRVQYFDEAQLRGLMQSFEADGCWIFDPHCGVLEDGGMKTVDTALVFCHPDPHSFGAALRRTAADTLRSAGHELREIDLYAEGFDPVFSAAEKAPVSGLRPLYAKRCRMRWLQLYNLNHVRGAERDAFLRRVKRELSVPLKDPVA